VLKNNDTVWRTDILTLLKTGKQKTEKSKQKTKQFLKWLNFIVNVAELTAQVFQV
jgi:hypothetical protein